MERLPVALCLLAFCLLCSSALGGRPTAGPLYIDCGNETDLGESHFQYGRQVYYTTGTNATIPGAAALGLTPQEATLRIFPPAGGCYNVSRPPGKYTVRLGFAYHNYDGLGLYPSFNVFLQGLQVDQVLLANLEGSDWSATLLAGSGLPHAVHYVEYTTFFSDPVTSAVSVCLVSVDSTSPVVSVLEIIPLDSDTFKEFTSLALQSSDYVLSLKHRINLGGDPIAEDQDPGFRIWHAMADSNGIGGHRNVTNYTATITGTSEFPEMLPKLVFQSAWEAADVAGNEPLSNKTGVALPFYQLRTSNPLFTRVYLCELNGAVRAGERVFNITFGAPVPGTTQVSPFMWDKDQRNVDIVKSVGAPYTAYVLPQFGCIPYMIAPAQGDLSTLYFAFSFLDGASQYTPIVSGLELYEVVPRSPASQATLACPQAPSAPPPAATTPMSVDNGTTTTTTTPAPPSSGLSGGAIAGIVIGVLVGLALIGALIYWLSTRTRNQRPSFQTFYGADGVGLTAG